MAEENQSFLEILNKYFSNIDESRIVAGSKEKVTIPMEWIFSENLDRAVIEKAFINLFCKANKSYIGKLRHNKEFYGQVASLEVEQTDSGTNLIINARDGWTKVVVTSNKDLRGPFYAINEDRLYEEILKVYNMKSVGDICKKFNLSMEEREQLIEEFRTPQKHEERKGTVISKMASAAENLTRYYNYMSKRKIRYEALSGAIQQRKDKGGTRTIIGGVRNPRRSEIYDFEDRDHVLQEMNPNQIINIDKVEEDNSVSKYAYVTYVYKNPRGREGYLLIAEPFEGNHHTRTRFVPQQEYDALQVRAGQNKLVHLAESMTEMSINEFDMCRNSRKFKHTSIEKYREKFRRIVLGEKVQSAAEEVRYAETDGILFDGELKFTKGNIKSFGSRVPASKLSGARSQLYAREKETEQPIQ